MSRIMRRGAILFILSILSVFACFLFPHSAQAVKPNPTQIVESTSDEEVDKVIYFAEVNQSAVAPNTIRISLENRGDYQIRNWSIVFNAEFTVESIENAELVSGSGAIQFKYLKSNSTLNPGDSVAVILHVGPGDKNIELFRVYAACSELSEDYVVNDCIACDLKSGEERLMISDEDETLFPEKSNSFGYEVAGGNAEIEDFPNLAADTFAIIGRDSRLMVRNVNLYTYSCIGRFIHRFPDNMEFWGTAFMIGNRHALTSAHCVYMNFQKGGKFIRSGYINFGESATSGRTRAVNVRGWRMSAAYRANHIPANDWACLIMQYSVNRGYLKVGFASPSQLKQRIMRVTGYGLNRLRPSLFYPEPFAMYTQSGRLSSISSFQLSYTMDLDGGQSGSPVYDKNNYVYGVSSGNNWENTRNYAAYLNKARVNYFLKMRWCGA